MSDANVHDLQDLIIIKRRLPTELEMPKGGVWKIAFADFMTAMMCFFLVMWLINAANEDTRQAVASYFNPIKLSEINPKGLRDPTVVPEGVEARDGTKTSAAVSAAGQARDQAPDKLDTSSGAAAPAGPEIDREALFRDPYAVLSRIAAEPVAAADTFEVTPEQATAVSAGQGDALLDPFDPAFRRPSSVPPARQPATRDSAALQATDASASAFDEEAEGAPRNAGKPIEPGAVQPDRQKSGTPDAPPENLAADTGLDAERASLEAALTKAVESAAGSRPAPGLELQRAADGMLISLTDNAAFGMFDVGSARPRPEMVAIMARIAGVLKTRVGAIVIRGHTDSRPFRTAAYDNWRLSTDRAQMAYYMLARAGLEEKRVESIEGYAARRPRNPAAPESAENRRIEILLRERAP